MIITAAILIFVSTLGIKISYDYSQWLKYHNVVMTKSITNHPKEIAIALIFLTISGVLFYMAGNRNWYNGIAIFFMQFFVFWTFFDGIYNSLRGFGFFFTGSDDKGDSWLDNVLQSMSVTAQAILKLGGCATFIYLYTKTF